MTSRIIPSASLPDLKSESPKVDSWVQRYLQPLVTQIFDQFRNVANLSQNNVFVGSRQKVSAVLPQVVWEDISAVADEKDWDMYADGGGNFFARAIKDDGSAATTWLTVSRTGTTIDSIVLAATLIQISSGLSAYADDAAAAVGGIPVGGLYRTASAVKIRVT